MQLLGVSASGAENGARRCQTRNRAPSGVRWFIRQARRTQADLTLELVRELDTVLNNTSLILLLEGGNRKLLFPSLRTDRELGLRFA